jgi:hypothetical protein
MHDAALRIDLVYIVKLSSGAGTSAALELGVRSRRLTSKRAHRLLWGLMVLSVLIVRAQWLGRNR